METSENDRTENIFSEALIKAQLDKIFLCQPFTVSEILRRFLSYIVTETFAGRSNTIKEYTIAVSVLNKPADFKPQQDAIVRIHAGRLRRALHYYYKEQGAHDTIEISVPKGSYVPEFRNLRVKEINARQPLPETGGLSESVTIAVLPFSTFETDIIKRSFANSLGEQISAAFCRFSGLSVVSYFTMQRLSDKNRNIENLASKYAAQYVITGNVQFESKKLRISVQLIDTLTGVQIWTEMYNRNFSASHLFEVSDNVVGKIVDALADFNGLITDQMVRGITKNKAGHAFATVLSYYNSFYSSFSQEEFKRTYSALETAVIHEPENEMAWAFYGELSLIALLFNQNTRENPLIQGLRGARMSLKLNPRSQHGYVTLAMVNIFRNDKKSSLDALEYAITLNPGASGFMGVIGCLMICIGEYERGMHLLESSMDRNNSFPAFFYLFTSLYYYKHRNYHLAFEESEKLGSPDLLLNTILRITSLSQMGRKTEAAELKHSINNYSFGKACLSSEYISKFLLDEDLIIQLSKGLKFANISLLTVA